MFFTAPGQVDGDISVMEYEATGMFLSGHPCDGLDGMYFIVDSKRKNTKSGKTMCIATLSSVDGIVEGISYNDIMDVASPGTVRRAILTPKGDAMFINHLA